MRLLLNGPVKRTRDMRTAKLLGQALELFILLGKLFVLLGKLLKKLLVLLGELFVFPGKLLEKLVHVLAVLFILLGKLLEKLLVLFGELFVFPGKLLEKLVLAVIGPSLLHHPQVLQVLPRLPWWGALLRHLPLGAANDCALGRARRGEGREPPWTVCRHFS